VRELIFWLPVVDTFRTLVFQPGSFERIDGMIV